MADVSTRYRSSTRFIPSRVYGISEEPSTSPGFRPSPTASRFHVSPNSPSFSPSSPDIDLQRFIPSRVYGISEEPSTTSPGFRPSPTASRFHVPPNSPSFAPSSPDIDLHSFPRPPSLSDPLPKPATVTALRSDVVAGPLDSLHSTLTPPPPQASSSKYASSLSNASVSSSSSGGQKGLKKAKERRSTGRGGSGNIIQPSKLDVGSVDEAEILRQRRLHAQLNPRARIASTGRGGTGNIKNASEAPPYDPSQDPDDMYEKIVVMEHNKVKEGEVPSTGRGGSGNIKGRRIKLKPSSLSKKGKGKMKASFSSSSSSNGTTTSSSVSDNFELSTLSSATSLSGHESIASPLRGSVLNMSATSSVDYSHGRLNPFSPLPPSVILRGIQDTASIDTSHTASKSSASSTGAASIHSSEGYGPLQPEKKKKWWNLTKRSKKNGKEAMPLTPTARNTFETPRPSLEGAQSIPEALLSPGLGGVHAQGFEVDPPDSPEIPPTPPPTPNVYPVLIRDLHQRLVEEFSLSSDPSMPDPSYFVPGRNNVIDNYFAGEESMDPDLWTLKEDDGEGSDQCSLESSFFEL